MDQREKQENHFKVWFTLSLGWSICGLEKKYVWIITKSWDPQWKSQLQYQVIIQILTDLLEITFFINEMVPKIQCRLTVNHMQWITNSE